VDLRWQVHRDVLMMLGAILLQSCAIVWWASSINARVENLELSRQASAPQAERLARVEVTLEVVKEGIAEIKRLVRREAP
jgi:hypothetical protein